MKRKPATVTMTFKVYLAKLEGAFNRGVEFAKQVKTKEKSKWPIRS